MKYSLSEVSKTLVALIGFIGFALLTFITFDPSLVEAVQLLVPAAITVIVTFMATNHNPADLQKAVSALIAAGLTVVSYFTEVPADTANKIGLAVGALVVVIGIYWKANTPKAVNG